MSASSPAEHGRLDVVYLVCQSITTGLFLAFIIGSLLFTGGRVLPDESTKWDEMWSWPVFPVSPWATIVPAALGALVVVPIARAMLRSNDSALVGRWGQTVPALVGAFAFDQLFPVASGTALFRSHAFAVVLSGFSAAVLTVTVLVLLARERRSERRTPEGPEALVSTARLAVGSLMTIACGAVLALFAWASIQGWWRIVAQATSGGSLRATSEPSPVGGAIVLSLLTTAWLLMTLAITRFVVRQVTARRRSAGRGRSEAS